MKKVNIFLSVIFLIIVILVAGFVLYKNNIKKEVFQKASQADLSVQIKTIKQKDNFFDINVEYPQFNRASADFNKKIEDLVNSSIIDFKKNSQDTFKAINDTAPAGQKKLDYPSEPFSFDCSWTKTQVNPNYISFVLNIYFFSGGAHGVNQVYAFNYDIKNKKEITVQDLLQDSQANLDKLAAVARKITYAQLKASDAFVEDMAKLGTEPTFENYKDFNFDQDNLIIYFQRYQVSFGAAGEITIKIPYSELKTAGVNSPFFMQ